MLLRLLRGIKTKQIQRSLLFTYVRRGTRINQHFDLLFVVVLPVVVVVVVVVQAVVVVAAAVVVVVLELW